MNFNLLIPLLITSVITVSGWFLLHRLSQNRDRENKRKDLRTNYLIEAWRRLEHAALRDKFDHTEYLENPIADIQLFGTKRQIELAQKLADDIANNGTANLDDLLKELRTDLRSELDLEKVPDSIKYLRITFKEIGKNK